RDVLNERMVERALASIADADVVCWLVDARQGLESGDREIAALLPTPPKPVVIALNKIDAVAKPTLLPMLAELATLAPDRPAIPISATTGEQVDTLLDTLAGLLPEGPRYYPGDELTDEPERAIAAEIIREKV